MILSHISKTFGDNHVLKDVSLEMKAGKIFSLVGLSGSGKSTLARIICQLERADQGALSFPNGSKAIMVPQDFVIWPNMTARENMLVGMKGAKKNPSYIESVIGLLRLDACQNIRAGKLSFGQQQRVAIGRALISNPDFLIFDETFSNLDYGTKHDVMPEVFGICRKLGVGALYITHDIQEMYRYADIVAILSNGIIAQEGSPEDVYWEPRSLEIARLTGDLVEVGKVCSPDELKRIFRGYDWVGDDLYAIRPDSLDPKYSGVKTAIRIDKVQFIGSGFWCFFKYKGNLEGSFLTLDKPALRYVEYFRLRHDPIRLVE